MSTLKNDSLSALSWVEQDPKEILHSVYECMDRTCEKLTQLNTDISNIKGINLVIVTDTNHDNVIHDYFIFIANCKVFVAIGVTNQRETTVVWDKETGEPLYNAVGK